MSELVPVGAVSAWLRGRLPGFSEITGVRKTTQGQSNPTFILQTDAGPLVLRRKPPGVLLKSAHAVEREFRVLQALADTEVPVPMVHALCEDEGVLGTPFFVMDFVEGVTEEDPRCLGLNTSQRAALYDDMNRVLASLHRLRPEALGLEEYGRPGNYFARQLTRWEGQYRASETTRHPAVDTLIAWLLEHVPPDDGAAALVHGDWRLDNLLFDASLGRIRAVLDWELSTLGHPLADLGAQIMQWAMPVGPDGRGLDGADREALGIPSDAAYVALYAERSGVDVRATLDFAVVFAFFRMAAILQGVLRRALDGNASNPERARALGAYVPSFAERALARLERG